MVDDRLLDRLLAATETQARAAAALVEIQRTTDSRLTRIEDSQGYGAVVLARVLQEMNGIAEARAAAVQELKDHTDLVIVKSERWWKVFALFAGALLAISQVLGALASNLISHPHGP